MTKKSKASLPTAPTVAPKSRLQSKANVGSEPAAPPLDWDDLRHVLAVADGGNLTLGAQILGVNHTTVLRRLAALEARLGGELFLRKARYIPTSLGDAAIAAARAMSHEAERLDQRLALGLQPLVGTIVLGVHHQFLADIAMPFAAEFLDAHSRVQVELIEDVDARALRQVDVLLGLGDPPRRFVTRQVCAVQWRAYAHAKLAARLTQPGAAEQATPWVDLADLPDLAQPHAWLNKQINASGERRVAVESLSAAAAAIRAGLGVGPLPTSLVASLGDTHGLQAVSEAIAPLGSSLWIAGSPKTQHVPRVVSFIEFMASRLAADSRLTGPASR